MLLANRNYRLLLGASGTSNLADGIAALALPWLATLLTRDPVMIGLVAFAGRVPWLLLSIPAGVITDRADRRRLIVQADILRAVLCLALVALILAAPTGGGGSIALLAALAFGFGAAEVLRDNAAQTLMPALVEAPQLERANGQLWSVETVMGQFVGPPLAGLLIALAVPAPFLVDAAAFAVAASLVWCITLPPRLAPPRRRWQTELREGLAWLWARPVLRRLALSLGAINALYAMGTTVLVLLAQERLGLGAAGYGWLLTAGAAGGVLGGLICPRVVERLGAQRSLNLSLMAMPLPLIVLAFAPHWSVAAAALFAEVVIGVQWNVVTVSYRQRTIPDALLGRVNSVYRFFGWGTISLGALGGGLLVAALEPALGRDGALSAPYLLGAAGTFALWLWGRTRLRLG
ncbi:MAG: MFS transporter [Pseudomonadota bacterium]